MTRDLAADPSKVPIDNGRVLIYIIASGTGFSMTSTNMPRSNDNLPIATFIELLLPASRQLNRLLFSLGYNERGELSLDEAESFVSYGLANDISCILYDGLRILRARLLVDKPRPFRVRERLARKIWRRIDRVCAELCASLTYMRRDLDVGDDAESRHSTRGLPNKDAREFCTRAISFLGRINGVANHLDELRQAKGYSEEQRRERTRNDLEEIWHWADKITLLVSSVASTGTPS